MKDGLEIRIINPDEISVQTSPVSDEVMDILKNSKSPQMKSLFSENGVFDNKRAHDYFVDSLKIKKN